MRELNPFNGVGEDSAGFWISHIEFTLIEAAFPSLKSESEVRSVDYEFGHRVEAQILIAFLVCCLKVTSKTRSRRHSPNLTLPAEMAKSGATLTIDDRIRTVDGPWLGLLR